MCAKDISVDDEQERERFYSDLVLHHSSDAVVICDPEGRALWINPAFTVQTGYGPKDVLGEAPLAMLRGAETEREALEQVALGFQQRREIRLDIRNYTRSGQPFWADLKVTPVYDTTGKHTHFIATMRDITDRKTLEDQNEEMRHAEALRQAERHLLALTSEWLYSARSFEELLMVIQRAMHTLIPEADGALYVFDKSRKMLDLTTSWGSMPEFEPQITPDDCWALRRGRAYAYGQKPIQFACDHVQKPGAPYFCLPIIAHGETIGLMHIVFEGYEESGPMRHLREEVFRNRWDVSLICAEQISLAVANVRLRQELQEKSWRDPLTGLRNRRWFMEHAQREITLAARNSQALALISVDVDHFKQFNDQYGHEAGDEVLSEVGRVMERVSGPDVVACRIGGEEFVFLCVNSDAERARAQAEHLRTEISEARLVVRGQTLPGITISAGLGLLGRDGATLQEVMHAADKALYHAKASGRDRVVTEAPEAGA